MKKLLLLPEPVKDALIRYLSQRPYLEVAEIITVLAGLTEMPAASSASEVPSIQAD